MATDHNNADEKPGGVVPIINQTGLPNTVKGKAQRFLLRWLAGGIANPYVRQVRDNLDELDGRSRVNMMLAEEVGRQAISDPVTMERAKARFLGDLHRKQENVEAIAQAAQAKIDAENDAAIENGPTAEPNEDWMNTFTSAAEGASSEQLRDRLASLLAGEIKNPGSISRAAIRFVAEVEADDLQQFSKVLMRRFRDNIYASSDWQSGDLLLIIRNLEGLGLVSTGLNTTVEINNESKGFLIGHNYALIFFGSIGVTKMIDICTLTRLGREVANLLQPNDEKSILLDISNDINKDGLTSIIIGVLNKVDDLTSNILHQNIIWSSLATSHITMPKVANPFNVTIPF